MWFMCLMAGGWLAEHQAFDIEAWVVLSSQGIAA